MFDLKTKFWFEEISRPTLFIKLKLLRPGLDPLEGEVSRGEPRGQVEGLVEVVNIEVDAGDVGEAL